MSIREQNPCIGLCAYFLYTENVLSVHLRKISHGKECSILPSNSSSHLRKDLKSTISDPHLQHHRTGTMTCSNRWDTGLFRVIWKMTDSHLLEKSSIINREYRIYLINALEPLSEWLCNMYYWINNMMNYWTYILMTRFSGTL